MISQRYKYDSKSSLKLNKIQNDTKSRVEECIKNGVYRFENISCAICGSENYELLAEKDRYGLECHTVICKDCGLVYINPRMTQESYNKFYDGEYRKLYIGIESPAEVYFRARYKKAKKILEFIKSVDPKIDFKGLNVLEVGCADGGILQFFKEQGCNVKGVDLGSEYLHYGIKNYNLDLTHGSLAALPPNFAPDIIIYSHVLEHVLDLNAELAQIRSKCTDNTLVFIEVPGIKNLKKIYKMDPLLYFQNAHTYHFSQVTLANLFLKNNFSLIKSNEHVRAVFTVKRGETSEIKNDYASTIAYLKKIEKNRFIYPFKPSTIRRRVKESIYRLIGKETRRRTLNT